MSKQVNIKKSVKRVLEKYSVSHISSASLKSIISANGYTVIGYSPLTVSEETDRLMENLGVLERSKHTDSITYCDGKIKIAFVRKDVSDDEYLYLLALSLGRIIHAHPDSAFILGTQTSEEANACAFASCMVNTSGAGIIANFLNFYPVYFTLLSAVIIISIILSFFKFFKPQAADTLFKNGQDFISVSAETINSISITGDNQIISHKQSESSDSSANQTVIGDFEPDDSHSNNSDKALHSENAYYVTKSGTKYHKENCSYISGKQVVSISDADISVRKYTPCSRCID